MDPQIDSSVVVAVEYLDIGRDICSEVRLENRSPTQCAVDVSEEQRPYNNSGLDEAASNIRRAPISDTSDELEKPKGENDGGYENGWHRHEDAKRLSQETKRKGGYRHSHESGCRHKDES